MDLTIAEYSKKFKVSQQSVYARIKRGTLSTVVKDNTKYIQCDASMFKDAKSSSVEDKKTVKVEQSVEQYKFKALRRDYKQLLKEVEKKDKKIEKDIKISHWPQIAARAQKVTRYIRVVAVN